MAGRIFSCTFSKREQTVIGVMYEEGGAIALTITIYNVVLRGRREKNPSINHNNPAGSVWCVWYLTLSL